LKKAGRLAGLPLTLFMAVLSTAGAQQSPGTLEQGTIPTIKVNVHLVNVFANVTDAQGAPVPNLKRDDFILKEDGKVQKIALFERETALPLNIVLAIDTSGSVHKDLDLESDAAHQFLEGLVRPVDRIEVIEFSDAVQEVVPFTSNVRQVERALNTLKSGDATAFYSGIYLGAQALGQRSGRKVLVVISDGGNTVKGVTYPQALEQAVRNEAMIYSIIDVPVAASAGRDLGGEHAMITLSEQTGGRWYYADASSLREVFAHVSEDLRTQYLLGYYPAQEKDSDAFRTISVQLRPDLPGAATEAVHHRPGYYPSH